MRPVSILLAMSLIGLRTAFAAEDAATAPMGTRVLDTVVVSGELPGPGLWKVSKGDHVMWVLGALTPTPRRMVWQSKAVESVIADADAVLLHPTASLRLGKGGIFGGLFLLPSLMGARKSADERELKEVLPPELYARWTLLRDRYLGRARAVEKRRPIFAVYALYEKATEKSGLSHEPFVGKVVRKAAKRHGIELIQPKIELVLENPRSTIKAFKQSELDDLECFARTLQHLEQDLETMKDRANAWATGDVALMQSLPYTDQSKACIDAILQNSAVQGSGLTDLPERLQNEWLTAAEAALAKHAQVFALLPMNELIEADGYLALLRAKGYAVEAPQPPP
jgi:uncharacterized protein YbaP (TraB family)